MEIKMENGKWKIVNRAFTLIELLVVISIIGILAAIALVSFTGAQRQARDTIRKSDLKMYSTALTQYASQHKGKYPSYAITTELSSLCSTLNLTNCPEDKENTYTYISDGSGSGSATATEYVISSTVEYSSNPSDTWVICSTGDIGYYSGTPGGSNCPQLLDEPPSVPVPPPPSGPGSSSIPASNTPYPTVSTCLNPQNCGGVFGECCTGYECIQGVCTKL